MNKFKAFFAKVRDYIKNTAWIQPLLIVVVIFVILFSLNPITNAIKKGWTNLTTTNDMEKITYEEYVKLINDSKANDKYVIVFTQKNCEHCPIFYKSMNAYLKDSKENRDFEIYNVDLSTKSRKVKLDGTKYSQYKDSTCGVVSTATTSNEKIISIDYIKKLDLRIEEFANSFGETYNQLSKISDSAYSYVGTPLVMWYEGGIETRITNIFENSESVNGIKLNNEGKQATASSFRNFIEDFGGKDDRYTVKADNWAEPFNLEYNSKKNLKDAYEAA